MTDVTYTLFSDKDYRLVKSMLHSATHVTYDLFVIDRLVINLYFHRCFKVDITYRLFSVDVLVSNIQLII